MNKIKKNITTFVGVVIGLIAGFLYWKYVGCASGACPITSNPIVSSLYGALLGGLIGSMFTSKKKKGGTNE